VSTFWGEGHVVDAVIKHVDRDEHDGVVVLVVDEAGTRASGVLGGLAGFVQPLASFALRRTKTTLASSFMALGTRGANGRSWRTRRHRLSANLEIMEMVESCGAAQHACHASAIS